MIILNHQIQIYTKAADRAHEENRQQDAERLDAKVARLDKENYRRLIAARARFEHFDEQARESGFLNAGQTTVDDEQTVTFNDFGDTALFMAEFWEAAVASIVDFRD